MRNRFGIASAIVWLAIQGCGGGGSSTTVVSASPVTSPDSIATTTGAASPAPTSAAPAAPSPTPAASTPGPAPTPAAGPVAATTSANGSYLGIGSQATKLVDGTGAKWTVSGGVISLAANGETRLAGYSANVTVLLWFGSRMFQRNLAGEWFRWEDYDVWSVYSGDPRYPATAASPNGSFLGAGSGLTQLVDNTLSIWTVANGVIFYALDGATRNAGFSANVTTLLWYANRIFQRNTAGEWYRWEGNDVWSGFAGDPRVLDSTPTQWPVSLILSSGLRTRYSPPGAGASQTFVGSDGGKTSFAASLSPPKSIDWSMSGGRLQIDRTGIGSFSHGIPFPPIVTIDCAPAQRSLTPFFAAVGASADLATMNCETKAQQTSPFQPQPAPTYTYATVLMRWWIEPSKVPGMVLVCLTNWGCYRGNQAGSIDPTKAPWLAE